MTYTIKFTDDTKTSFSIPTYQFNGPGATNGQNTSLMLVGKGYADYGEELWTNLVHILENHSNSLPPQSPIEGQIWYDNSLSSNLKIYKRGPGTQHRWVDIVDTETLQKLLYSSDFFSESILQYDVRIPAGVTNLHGNVHIHGKLEVDDGIYSYKAPESMSEVVPLGFLNTKLATITSKYVPLKSPPGGSTITGGLTIDGEFRAKQKIYINNLPVDDSEGANKLYVDNQIKNSGLGWPTKKPLTVLLTSNGKDVEFSDITPDYICHYDGTIPSGSTQYMVIAGDNTAETAYWQSLDTDYVYVGNSNSSDQEIVGPKSFNKVTLKGEVHDSVGPGTAGQVLKSQGPNLPPIWGVSGGGGGGSTPSFTGMFENGVNETVTVTSGSNTITYQRGFMRLPNDMIAQWIIGYPLSSTGTLLPTPFKTNNTYTFLTENTLELNFLYSTMNVNDNIISRYTWKFPFENINFKSVTSNLHDNIGVFSQASTNYKWSDFGSTNFRPCVLFQRSIDRQWADDFSSPSFVPVSPIIFALGKEDKSASPVDLPTQLVFNTTGTIWTVPSTAQSISCTLVGGGGGGYKGINDNDWQYGGGGGGSGAITTYSLPSSKFGKTLKMYIGSGGNSTLNGTQTSINEQKDSTDTLYSVRLATAKGGASPTKKLIGGLGGLPGGNNGTEGKEDTDSNSTAKVRTGKGGDSPLAPGSGGRKGDSNELQPDVNGVATYGIGGPGQYWGAGGGGGLNGREGGAGMKGVVIVNIIY